MGLFSGLGEKLWGGNNNSQQKEQIRQNRYAQRYAQQQVGQSRSDIQTLGQAADDARNYGYNQALDVQAQAMPVQANYFQGGNMAAQNAIIGGQPFTYQAPQVDPMYFRQQDFRMPYWQQPELGYVPMLQQPVGYGESDKQGIHVDQGWQSGYQPPSQRAASMPVAGNFQGRFGRYV